MLSLRPDMRGSVRQRAFLGVLGSLTPGRGRLGSCSRGGCRYLRPLYPKPGPGAPSLPPPFCC